MVNNVSFSIAFLDYPQNNRLIWVDGDHICLIRNVCKRGLTSYDLMAKNLEIVTVQFNIMGTCRGNRGNMGTKKFIHLFLFSSTVKKRMSSLFPAQTRGQDQDPVKYL